MFRARIAAWSWAAGLMLCTHAAARPDPPPPPPPPPPVSVQTDITSPLPMGPKGTVVTINGRIGAVIGQNEDTDGTGAPLPLVAGLDISAPASLPPGTELQCINIVETDSVQGWKWKEQRRDIFHLAPIDSPRIDPLPGGNISPGRFAPAPEADYEIFWEREMTGRNVTPKSWASSRGFDDLNLTAVFAAAASLEIAFADRANGTERLQCATLFVLVDRKGHRIGVIGGFRWGVDADGNRRAVAPFSGLDGFTTQQLGAIATSSGFTGWRFVPTPGSAALLAMAMVLTLWRSVRAMDPTARGRAGAA